MKSRGKSCVKSLISSKFVSVWVTYFAPLTQTTVLSTFEIMTICFLMSNNPTFLPGQSYISDPVIFRFFLALDCKGLSMWFPKKVSSFLLRILLLLQLLLLPVYSFHLQPTCQHPELPKERHKHVTPWQAVLPRALHIW